MREVRPDPPKVIWLFGEDEFPQVEVGDTRDMVQPEELGLSDATTALIRRWLSLVEEGLDRDAAVLAGVRAAAAIARELNFKTRVDLAMVDKDDLWFTVVTRDPGESGPGWACELHQP